ncbi:MAG: DUF2460 domain-containing protein [Pseudomonadota bacterium]
MAIEILNLEFPLDPTYDTRSGPEWRTQINTLNSGVEDAVSLWQFPRYRVEVLIGRKNLEALQLLEDFINIVRGRGRGFLFRDPLRAATGAGPHFDAAGQLAPSFGAADVSIGSGDGTVTDFPLQRVATIGGESIARRYTRPDAGVRVSLGGTEQLSGFSLQPGGVVRFDVPPESGVAVAAGFAYRLPVRLEDDWSPVNLSGFRQGEPARLTMIEIRE